MSDRRGCLAEEFRALFVVVFPAYSCSSYPRDDMMYPDARTAMFVDGFEVRYRSPHSRGIL